MAHPIGYYISARPENPVASILATLERRYGAYFERLSVQDLQSILALCTLWCLDADATFYTDFSRCSAQACAAIDILAEFHELRDSSWHRAFIPFLYEQISSRYQEVDRDAN